MSTHYVLSTSMFCEGEEREFDEPQDHAMYPTRNEAEYAAEELTTRLRSILDYLVRLDGSDGISVEIVPCVVNDGAVTDYAIELAIEVVPGRPRVLWHGDECRDNCHPRLVLNESEL